MPPWSGTAPRQVVPPNVVHCFLIASFLCVPLEKKIQCDCSCLRKQNLNSPPVAQQFPCHCNHQGDCSHNPAPTAAVGKRWSAGRPWGWIPAHQKMTGSASETVERRETEGARQIRRMGRMEEAVVSGLGEARLIRKESWEATGIPGMCRRLVLCLG